MHSYTTDTSPAAEAIQWELYSKMTPQQRLAKAFRLSAGVARMAKNAIRRENPGFTEQQVGIKFVELCYGSKLASAVEAHIAAK